MAITVWALIEGAAVRGAEQRLGLSAVAGSCTVLPVSLAALRHLAAHQEASRDA